jgi:hypothetical protein
MSREKKNKALEDFYHINAVLPEPMINTGSKKIGSKSGVSFSKESMMASARDLEKSMVSDISR